MLKVLIIPLLTSIDSISGKCSHQNVDQAVENRNNTQYDPSDGHYRRNLGGGRNVRFLGPEEEHQRLIASHQNPGIYYVKPPSPPPPESYKKLKIYRGALKATLLGSG